MTDRLVRVEIFYQIKFLLMNKLNYSLDLRNFHVHNTDLSQRDWVRGLYIYLVGTGGSQVRMFDCIEEEAGGGVGGSRGRLLYQS